MGALFFNIRVRNVKLVNEKKILKYHSLNVGEPLQIDTTP